MGSDGGGTPPTSSATSGASSSTDFRTQDRDKSVYEAALGLNHFVLVAAWTSIAALILVFINEFTNNAIPSWGIFTVLFFGHFVLLLVVMRILRLILRSLLPKNDAERSTQKWHQANEKRIPLIQYTVYNVSWIFGVSFLLVIIEVLALLYYEGVAPVYASLAPIYLLTGVALINSVLCRSTSLVGALTWGALFTQTLLYNLKEVASTADLLTWTEVLIPAFAVIVMWLVVVLFIWIQYLRSVYHLHQYQVECLVLYFLAGSAFFVSGYGLMAYLEGQEIFGAVPDQKFATGAAIVGACFFFSGLSIAMDNIVRAAIDRMGGERPRTLVRTAGGSWDVDWNNSHQNYLIMGDIESAKFKHLVGSGERGCGCCASLELVARNTVCGFGEFGEGGAFSDRNSDEEGASETAPLRGSLAAAAAAAAATSSGRDNRDSRGGGAWRSSSQ